MKPAVVLFWHDLRLQDNPALFHAAKTKKPLVLLFIEDAQAAGRFKTKGAAKWWQYKSLIALLQDLAQYRQHLVVRSGHFVDEVMRAVHETGADAIFWNRSYEPWRVKELTALKKQPIETHSFNANYLKEPWELSTQAGTPFRVFTPFWKSLQKGLELEAPLQIPQLSPATHDLKGEDLAQWRSPTWAKGFSVWNPSEQGAWGAFEQFLPHLKNYPQMRDRPDVEGTSRLSPFLHFGQISPRQILWKLKEYSCEKFVSELAWREFSNHLLFHFPDLPTKNFNPKFDRFPWKKDDKALRAWQEGKTGVPLIDAGMRQLWHEGWMHNRVRMLVASFLTKDLLIDWREGADWFWDTLVDADLANNSASWQWVAGSGADAAPYYRIFNPYVQAERFDPDGAYVKKWGGEAHPFDHKEAAKRALDLFHGLNS